MFNQFMQLSVCITLLCSLLANELVLAQSNTRTATFTRHADVVALQSTQHQYQFRPTSIQATQANQTGVYVFQFVKAGISDIRGEGPKASTWSKGYNAIVYNNVYPNTRVKFYANTAQELAYKWDIKQKKALKAVKWKISEVDAAYLNENGILVLEKQGETRHISPPIVQQIIKSDSGNSLHKTIAVFKLSSKNVLSISLPKDFTVNPNFPIYLFGTL